MTGRPTISMVMIARDEASNIEPCFSSWWDDVDEVVLVDTGSTDDTMLRARQFATRRGGRRKLKIRTFRWRDDFASARNYADSQATGEWLTWCDLDDTIVRADQLRELAAAADPGISALMFQYQYAVDAHGNVICTLSRERLVRAGHGRWDGRVHEAQAIGGQLTPAPGRAQVVPATTGVMWRHRKDPDLAPTGRNLRILESWAIDEPDNGRVLQYLGTERAASGQHQAAVDAYQRYLARRGEPPEHRAQCWRRLACSLIALDRVQDAFDAGLRALAENPSWPDCYLTLAQTAHVLGEHTKCLEWAAEALRRGKPDTLLIVNPLDYTVEPRVAMAGSLAALGRLDEAVACGELALQVRPDHPLLAEPFRQWRGEQKRRRTVQTWLACAEMLVAHDEQQKALDLLESTVPYFAVDHPDIVAARSRLRERLAFAARPELYTEHYVTGGSKPEDMIADDRIAGVCGSLPRVQFLRRHLTELAAEAA